MKPKKTYDMQTKKWVHPDTVATLAKSKLCKGKRQHEYALTVPYYNFIDELKPEMIARYYEIEDWHTEMKKEYNQKMKDAGFSISKWNSPQSRYYICVECGKREYNL